MPLARDTYLWLSRLSREPVQCKNHSLKGQQDAMQQLRALDVIAGHLGSQGAPLHRAGEGTGSVHFGARRGSRPRRDASVVRKPQPAPPIDFRSNQAS